MFSDGPEVALPKGDVTEGVVRIGDTVRRPHSETSETVAAYLAHLERRGLAGVPRYLGRDAQGRDVLTFLAGDVPGDPVEPWTAADHVLPGVARLLRRLHDASEGFVLPDEAEVAGRPQPRFPVGEPRLVAQRDVTPQNTVFRDGEAWGLIDFDLTSWTTRSVDLVNTALHWVPLCDPVDRAPVHHGVDAGARLRLLYDAYGRDRIDVARLLEACECRFGGSYAIMKWRAETYGGGWRRMWDEGIGDVITRRVRWFESVREDLRAALDVTSPSAR